MSVFEKYYELLSQLHRKAILTQNHKRAIELFEAMALASLAIDTKWSKQFASPSPR